MMRYQNISLNRNMYTSGESLSAQLEQLDPSSYYADTSLKTLDAFQRQLKRFTIRCKGSKADKLAKFFCTRESAVLFPEYVRRCILTGMTDVSARIDDLTKISRTSSRNYQDTGLYIQEISPNNEGTQLELKKTCIDLNFHTIILRCAYSAIEDLSISEFSEILKNVGLRLAYDEFQDMVHKLETSASTATFCSESDIWNGVSTLQKLVLPYQLNAIIYSTDLPNSVAQAITSSESIHSYPAALNNGVQAIVFDRAHTLEYIKGDPYVSIDADALIQQNWEHCSITVKSAFNVIDGRSLGILRW